MPTTASTLHADYLHFLDGSAGVQKKRHIYTAGVAGGRVNAGRCSGLPKAARQSSRFFFFHIK